MKTGFEVAALIIRHWFLLASVTALAICLWTQRQYRREYAKERRRDRRIRQELEAYARLDARLPPSGDARDLGQRVCRLVAEKSAFPKVAMLTRAADGRLSIAASAGMDEWTLAALDGWCSQVMKMQFPARAKVWNRDETGGRRSGTSHFTIELGLTREALEQTPQSTVIPFWSMTGRMVGALVVCPRKATGRRRGVVLEEALPPLEALAVRLARSLENVALAERLLRAEKLAGLGQLAGGVAHALNNPLTAVLGFAELIAETAEEPRVRKDAVTIVREALSMRDTVQGLMHFWRPEGRTDVAIAVQPLLRELAAACEAKLAARGVRLIVQIAEDVPEIRGDEEQLREVMEHLLNNAAQAIQSQQSSEQNHAGDDEIRISVSHDECSLHVIVSDTGPGFEEPGKVFDPFYTTQQVGAGSGMGLSVCYGIVREHGGEISAFNLHPHGAAVVVELPIGSVVRESVVVEEAMA